MCRMILRIPLGTLWFLVTVLVREHAPLGGHDRLATLSPCNQGTHTSSHKAVQLSKMLSPVPRRHSRSPEVYKLSELDALPRNILRKMYSMGNSKLIPEPDSLGFGRGGERGFRVRTVEPRYMFWCVCVCGKGEGVRQKMWPLPPLLPSPLPNRFTRFNGARTLTPEHVTAPYEHQIQIPFLIVCSAAYQTPSAFAWTRNPGFTPEKSTRIGNLGVFVIIGNNFISTHSREATCPTRHRNRRSVSGAPCHCDHWSSDLQGSMGRESRSALHHNVGTCAHVAVDGQSACRRTDIARMVRCRRVDIAPVCNWFSGPKKGCQGGRPRLGLVCSRTPAQPTPAQPVEQFFLA